MTTPACTEPGCDRPVYCKDLCSGHYQKVRAAARRDDARTTESRLLALAARLEAALPGLEGKSDEEKLRTLRQIARLAGASPDRRWPDSDEVVRIVKREPSFIGRDLAWTAPHGAERGWA